MKRTQGSHALNAAGLLCAALSMTLVSRAEDIYWSGAAGLWSDNTWSPQAPLGANGDHAYIEEQVVTIQDGIDATTGALIVRDSGGLVMTGGWLDLMGDAYYNVFLAIGDFDSAQGSFTMSGGTLNAYDGRIAIGFDQNSVGVATISGGTISHTNEFWVGQGAGSDGTLTLSGDAQINGTSWFAVGREGGTGELVVKDNAIINKSNGGNFKIAGDTGSQGTATIEGSGRVTINGVTEIGVGTNTTGVLTIKDSALVENPGLWSFMGGGGNTATLNLDGGAFKSNWIGKQGGTTTINFNGGTLIAQESGTSYLSAFADSDLHVLAGGFKFDSNGFDVAIVQGLSGVGSVTKLGEGALTLSGVGSYAGDTIVEEGVLILTQVGVLNDASTVRLETMESLVLAHGGTETVAGLVVGGVAQAPGPYTFGSGTLQVGGSSGDPFQTWAAAKGLDGTPGKESGLNDDPDGDGQANVIEFALNGDPLDPSDNGRIHVMTADSDAPGDPSAASELILTIAVLADTPAFTGTTSVSATIDGTTYTIQGSQDLTGFLTSVHPVTPITGTLPGAGTGYEYRSFSLGGSDGLTGKGFLRVVVER
ncbi:hypothetical protein OKA04_04080 [Luteolibacter flavescens]|uniref:Uncharacterized protein n=1 Tax=Luteolibacter flavescens TaxID=1859460 RepID=A0ABT3FK00_9BACT|nr:autotransporter-associated beta strand repeat-containing protein [Luteolibacter flavescens]MCW1883892.1 hypothetical protein [Luteolibacter flavescens]